jgi:hypothetical protein
MARRFVAEFQLWIEVVRVEITANGSRDATKKKRPEAEDFFPLRPSEPENRFYSFSKNSHPEHEM